MASVSDSLRAALLSVRSFDDACLVIPSLHLSDLKKFMKLLLTPNVSFRKLKQHRRSLQNVVESIGACIELPASMKPASSSSTSDPRHVKINYEK